MVALPAAVLALSCFYQPVVEAAGHTDAVSIDAVSMMQTLTVAKTDRQSSKSGVLGGVRKTEHFKRVSVPYKFYAADRSEVSDLPQNLSLGQMYAYDPTQPRNSDLFVFLPGSWVECKNYTQLLETIGSRMKTLCLPYDNVKAMFELCSTDSQCWFEKRVDASSGDFDHVSGNNIVVRLQSALAYMKKEHGKEWAEYIPGPTELKYDKMRIGGHSQGAGAAAMLAYQNKVKRVVQFSGPCDPSDWPKAMHSETPANRFYGMASWYDRFCDWETRQVPNWNNEGIASDASPPALVTSGNLSSYDPANAQTVISLIQSPVCKYDGCYRDSHDSTALDKWEEDKAPYADGLWQKLVGV